MHRSICHPSYLALSFLKPSKAFHALGLFLAGNRGDSRVDYCQQKDRQVPRSLWESLESQTAPKDDATPIRSVCTNFILA